MGQGKLYAIMFGFSCSILYIKLARTLIHFPLQTRTKLACALFSLPIPSNSVHTGEEIEDGARSLSSEQQTIHKLLLVGHKKSGTSTIFKQVISVIILQLCFLNFYL